MKWVYVFLIAIYCIVAVQATGRPSKGKGSRPKRKSRFENFKTKLDERLKEKIPLSDDKINEFLSLFPKSRDASGDHQQIKNHVAQLLDKAPKSTESDEKFAPTSMWLFKLLVRLVQETTSTVQDLGLLLTFVFRQPGVDKRAMDNLLQSIMDITKRHEAKENLTNGDLKFIEKELHQLEERLGQHLFNMPVTSRRPDQRYPTFSVTAAIEAAVLQITLLNRNGGVTVSEDPSRIRGVVQKVMRVRGIFDILHHYTSAAEDKACLEKATNEYILAFLKKNGKINEELLEESDKKINAWLSFVRAEGSKYDQYLTPNKREDRSRFIRNFVSLGNDVMTKYCGEKSKQFDLMSGAGIDLFKLMGRITSNADKKNLESFRNSLFYMRHFKNGRRK